MNGIVTPEEDFRLNIMRERAVYEEQAAAKKQLSVAFFARYMDWRPNKQDLIGGDLR